MNTSSAMNLGKLPEFICQLYDMKYKPATPLNTRIKGVLSRKSSDVPQEVRQAEKLQRRISAHFPLNDAIPLSWGEVGRFKDILHNFALEIEATIGEGRIDPFGLARCTFRFAKKWNKLVKSMEDMFLPGYGQINCNELSILTSDRENMTELFTKMRKAQRLPSELGCLHIKVNQKAITTSIDAYFKLLDRQSATRGG